MKRKLRSKRGFSLAETLLAVLILLLVSLIVANGVPAAKEAYEKVVIGANAKVLLSTTIATLRDELATARDVRVSSDGKTITYFSADRGATSRIYLSKEDDHDVIMLQEYLTLKPGSDTEYLPSASPRPLVPRKAATGDMYVTFDTATGVLEAGGTNYIGIKFTTIGVCRGNNTLSNTPEKVTNLTIRLIKPSVTPTPTT